MANTRRKQVERSEASRRKVIDAVVRCVEQGGVTSASTANIAREAGVTWGVLQHQFGSKQKIFTAVIETASSELLVSLDALKPLEDQHLEDAVKKFVDVLWSYFSTPMYRAFMEIILNEGHQGADYSKMENEIREAIHDRWASLLQSSGVIFDKKMSATAGELLELALMGMAMAQATQPSQHLSFRKHQKLLVESIVNSLRS